ncbi:(Fe-S)-binding protein [Prosthecomicrobium hirschii]|uniref:(Fe-S)-binding protein n=1 Tax=Prosthecodimorpha hirschii TaxID=665126 RepID=A0A0P6VHD7_9HYPH|nr:aromatic ring-hydroxylating dioxygenase subunit alpha [Prosthecomicrobium hirschii]KPL51454.1 (Fe-S)-binding protein [Prosthecomicrobium hirschii]
MLSRAPLDIPRLIAERRRGYTLAAPFYRAREIFDLDLEVIFGRHWIFAGVEAELPEPGDYTRLDIGHLSIVIVRGDDGAVRAFHNVCRHRGARLVTQEAGCVGKLVCPYHQWTYELTGELIHASHMGEDFDPSCHGLKPVHLRSIGGLIFVCMAAEAPADIDDLAAVLEPRLAPFDLRNAKVAKQVDLVEEGNWKLTMENNRECYHCAGNHPELGQSFNKYAVGFVPDADDLAGQAEAAAYEAQVAAQVADWEARGFPSVAVEHLSGRATGFRTERIMLDGSGESQTLDTKAACRKLLGGLSDAKLGGLHLWTQPNSWHHFMGDHAVTFCAIPLDPEHTLVRTRWLVHKDAVEGVDYDLDRLTEVWNATNAQDAALVELAQQGVRSPAYEPGPYSPLTEGLVDQFATWYVERLRAHLG